MYIAENTPNQKPRRNKKPLLIISTLLILVTAATTFLIRQNTPDWNDPKTITSKVSEHILLPTEEPTITTIENAATVTDQPFFQHAKNGDKLLVFSASARIIIYRPSENLLINVGPILDDTQQPAQTPPEN